MPEFSHSLAADRDWLIPSAVLTAGMTALALILIPVLGFRDLPNPLFSLSGSLKFALICGGGVIIVRTLRMAKKGLDSPASRLLADARANRAHLRIIVVAMLLQAVSVYSFMILKPELNVLFPFWADQLLADLDKATVGVDPWTLFPAWDHSWVGDFYTYGWYLSLLVTYFWLALQKPSTEKSAGLLSYFVIWILFGPITQALMSSAGPIFFDRVGLGERFADMPTANVSQFIADYLWALFETRSLAPGAGISAMPSMHIATVAWMVICLAAARTRWAILAFFFSLFMYACSIALGWHYASDGLVGIAGAGLCYWVSRTYISRAARRRAVHANADPALAGA